MRVFSLLYIDPFISVFFNPYIGVYRPSHKLFVSVLIKISFTSAIVNSVKGNNNLIFQIKYYFFHDVKFSSLEWMSCPAWSRFQCRETPSPYTCQQIINVRSEYVSMQFEQVPLFCSATCEAHAHSIKSQIKSFCVFCVKHHRYQTQIHTNCC